MMADEIPILYWDACVLLSWVDDHPDRAPLIDLLLADARTGKVEVVTSAISQVEVAFAESEKMKRALSPEEDRKITGLWAPGGPVKIVEVHPLITARARNIVRDGMVRGWSLRAHDAIHLATAQNEVASEMHTYEPKLRKYGELIGIEVVEPRTESPRIV